MPTVKASEYQVVAAVIGPKADRYTIVAGLKLKDGEAKLGEHVVHEVSSRTTLNDIPPALRDKISLDVAKVGDAAIHKFELPKDPKSDKLLDQIVGANQIYIAFRDDALFVALGRDGLATLKTVLARNDSTASQPLLFDFDVARMAKLMAQTVEQKELAAKLFANGENGRVRLSLEGGPTLSARLQMRLNVLEFLVKLKSDKE